MDNLHMMMADIHKPTSWHCAFCKHWNDRQNTHIKHKVFDLWYYEQQAKEYCDIKRTDMKAFAYCRHYENKFE